MNETLFDGEEAFKHLKMLAEEIGARPSGSEAERKAAKYIQKYFEKLGLDVQIQEFEVTAGKVKSKLLEVLKPNLGEIPCEAMPLTGGTGVEGVEGEIVYVESTDEEYLDSKIAGKIILTPRFTRKSMNILMKYKPLAIICIENYPKIYPKHLWGMPEHREKYGSIPILRITFEDGLKLLDSKVEKLRVIVETEEEKAKSQNVIGELKGTSRDDEIVIIGGHYDTVPNVSGAGDNAGGTSIVMELAKVFVEKGSRRTMRFIAWGAEEMGLRGSIFYAKKLKEKAEEFKKSGGDGKSELERVKLALNLDVHGAMIGSNSAAILGPPELTAAVKLLSKELGILYNVREGVYSSDGTSLSSIGIPSVSFSRSSGSNIFMHSIEDSMRWLRPQALQIQGEFIEIFLTRYVAEAAAFPFERKIPDKLRKEIENYFKNRLMLKPP
ncbi:MAG: hypothetical protein DRJ30_04050 [Candidatus Methanomethylicota archaeon]|nr:MAG: hypothetical protein DRJ30_04050 [Candidatus Verstraetearchaeota archaeon]